MGIFANSEPGGRLLGRIQLALLQHENKLNKGETVEVDEPEGTESKHWKWCKKEFASQGYKIEKHDTWFSGTKVKITKKK